MLLNTKYGVLYLISLSTEKRKNKNEKNIKKKTNLLCQRLKDPMWEE